MVNELRAWEKEREKENHLGMYSRPLWGDRYRGIIGRGIHALVTRPTTDDNHAHIAQIAKRPRFLSVAVDRQFAVTIDSRNVSSGKFPE